MSTKKGTLKKQFQIPVKHYTEVRSDTEHGVGYRSVYSHTTTETVELEIDLTTLILELGTVAVRSKGGKTRACAGLVRVKHVRPRKKVSTAPGPEATA